MAVTGLPDDHPVAGFPQWTRNLAAEINVGWSDSGIAVLSGLSLSASARYKVDAAGFVSWRGSVYGPAPAGGAGVIRFPSAIAPAERATFACAGLAGVAIFSVGSYGGAGLSTEIWFRTMAAGAWPTASVNSIDLSQIRWSIK